MGVVIHRNTGILVKTLSTEGKHSHLNLGSKKRKLSAFEDQLTKVTIRWYNEDNAGDLL